MAAAEGLWSKPWDGDREGVVGRRFAPPVVVAPPALLNCSCGNDRNALDQLEVPKAVQC